MDFAKFVQDPKSHCPSPNAIEKLVSRNSFILGDVGKEAEQCLAFWANGQLTREEALGAALVTIFEELVYRIKQAYELHMELGIPVGRTFTAINPDTNGECSPRASGQ